MSSSNTVLCVSWLLPPDAPLWSLCVWPLSPCVVCAVMLPPVRCSDDGVMERERRLVAVCARGAHDSANRRAHSHLQHHATTSTRSHHHQQLQLVHLLIPLLLRAGTARAQLPSPAGGHAPPEALLFPEVFPPDGRYRDGERHQEQRRCAQ